MQLKVLKDVEKGASYVDLILTVICKTLLHPLSVTKISPDLQRPENGVVGLALTHWLTWCPQNPPCTDFYLEKNGPLCLSGKMLNYKGQEG